MLVRLILTKVKGHKKMAGDNIEKLYKNYDILAAAKDEISQVTYLDYFNTFYYSNLWCSLYNMCSFIIAIIVS